MQKEQQQQKQHNISKADKIVDHGEQWRHFYLQIQCILKVWRYWPKKA